jgi:hypothetical protein
MPSGLFSAALEAINAEMTPVSFPADLPRKHAIDLVATGPGNQEIVDACRTAYHQHSNAVDQLTIGSVTSAQAKENQEHIEALHHYDWRSRVPATGLARPIMESAPMAAAGDAARGAFRSATRCRSGWPTKVCGSR